ncbi:pumilio homolog 3 [Caerostris extrusa]|uniref:Pumilio homolog 3 n=1 Tax=Caerostris extrusa TaxID=172846 RepID=A0AAV4SDY0_CAEEX|nr:pumilio homolog 3 [Caerostris extrusa]
MEKEEKNQKPYSDSDISKVAFTANNEPNLKENVRSESVENENVDNNVNLKSILKKRKNELEDPISKKKIKSDNLTGKERKILHLNKKEKPQNMKRKTDDSAKTNEVVKKDHLTGKEWKKLKMQKKGKGEQFELGQSLKNIWEELRREDCKPERKNQLLKQACDVLKGRVKEFTFAHDTVRVLECILAEGAENHRDLLFNEVKDDILFLAKSKYGKFLVQKILRYGSKTQKEAVRKAFHGKVVKLIRHTEAAETIELIFNEFANAAQRFELVQEFYDPTYMHFKTYEISSLAELFEKEPNKKQSVIQNMKEALLKMLDKSVIKHSIVHHILWQFMKHADSVSRNEMIESVKEIVHEILHTKDGARVGMHCVWYGTLKDRKVIAKSMKTYVAKIAMEEFGHRVLLALFSCFDDTVFLKKHIIKELIAKLLDVAQNIYGKKVLAYLLNPAESHYVHPQMRNILEEGEIKKDLNVRCSELKAAIVDPLLKMITSNIQNLFTDNSFCHFTLVVLKHADEHKEEAFKAIADLVLIKQKASLKNDVEFSEVLIQTVPNMVFKSWIECNRGAFLLVNLLETEIPAVVKRIKEELAGCKKYLSKKSYVGAAIVKKET